MRISDWSSDVCSSDLSLLRIEKRPARHGHHIRANPLRFQGVSDTKREFDFRAAGEENNIAGRRRGTQAIRAPRAQIFAFFPTELRQVLARQSQSRSEERRLGKECVRPGLTRWSPDTS